MKSERDYVDKEIRRFKKEARMAEGEAANFMVENYQAVSPINVILGRIVIGLWVILLIFLIVDGFYTLFAGLCVLIFLFTATPLKKYSNGGGALMSIALVVYFVAVKYWMGLGLIVLYLAINIISVRIETKNAKTILREAYLKDLSTTGPDSHASEGNS